MRLCIVPKIVIRVPAVLTLSAGLVCASISAGRHKVNTVSAPHGVSIESGGDRVALAADYKNRDGQDYDSVGTDIILRSGHAKQESGRNVDDRPISPRLAALQDRLKAGDRHALESFWKEIEQSGTPMIEPVAGSDRDVLVTILWRGSEETKSVFVFQIPSIERPMARMLDTDLWYKTFQLPKGARFVYRLATNLPDSKQWTSLARFGSAMRSDPLNPLQFAERANELTPMK